MQIASRSLFFFFFNDPATTEIYTLSLPDALPILRAACEPAQGAPTRPPLTGPSRAASFHRTAPGSTTSPASRLPPPVSRSEEHTSELQSQSNLVCRLLLEKKKNQNTNTPT